MGQGQRARSLSDIAIRHEAKEGQKLRDCGPLKKPEAYSLEYGEDFSGPRTT